MGCKQFLIFRFREFIGSFFNNRRILTQLNRIDSTLNFVINNILDIESIRTFPSLKNLQVQEFKLLERIDIFFKEHNIEYFVYGGCLLGAVRHRGFIPWDDDIDIGVLHEDFDKLLDLESELLNAGLRLSSIFSRGKSYSQVGYDKIYDLDTNVHVSVCVFDLVRAADSESILQQRNRYHKKSQGILRNKNSSIKPIFKKHYRLSEKYYSGIKSCIKQEASVQ